MIMFTYSVLFSGTGLRFVFNLMFFVGFVGLLLKKHKINYNGSPLNSYDHVGPLGN